MKQKKSINRISFGPYSMVLKSEQVLYYKENNLVKARDVRASYGALEFKAEAVKLATANGFAKSDILETEDK